MNDFSTIDLQRFNTGARGPFIKFRRERVGESDQEFWLSVGDEINIHMGDPKIPSICFTIVEVQASVPERSTEQT